MSDVECALCVWLSELPASLQILLGLIFLTLVAPALFWLLASVTPGIDRMFERYLADPPNRYDKRQQPPPTEDSQEKSVAGVNGETVKFYIVSNPPGAADSEP